MSELLTKYNFDAANEHELSFVKGERLEIISRETQNWWKARNAKGKSGMVPSNYVEVLEQQRRMSNARSSRRLSLSAGGLFDTAELIAKVEQLAAEELRASIEPRGVKDRKWIEKSVGEFGAFDKQLRLVADDDGSWALSSVPALSEGAVAKALKTGDARALEKWLQALVETPSLRALAIAFVSGGRVTGDAELKKVDEEDEEKTLAEDDEEDQGKEEAPPHKLLAATALWEFIPSSESELGLDEGDVVEIAVSETANLDDPEAVIKAEATDGWLLGRCERTRDVGYFPALYVKPKPPDETKRRPSKTPPPAAEKKEKRPQPAASSSLPTTTNPPPSRAAASSSSRASRPASMRSLAAFDALTSKGVAVEPVEESPFSTEAPAKGSQPAQDGDVVRFCCTASSWDGGAGLSTPFASTEWDDDEVILEVGDTDVATDGLHVALRGLHRGDAVRATCAPKLAYGDAGLPGSVPQGSFLIYDILVLDVGLSSQQPRGPLPLLARPASADNDHGQKNGRVVSQRKRLTLDSGPAVRPSYRTHTNTLPTHHEVDNEASA